jgi:hypothetical protein
LPLPLVGLLLAQSATGAPQWQSGDGHRFQVLQGRAVAQGSARAGFTLLPPADAGVGFSNGLPAKLMTENNNFMNGSGVAAGDVDGDGWCDLYFCAISGTNALYRNLGAWRFEEVTARAGVGCPGLHSTGALFADLDADGDLDLLVATLGQGVQSLANDGQGRFTETTMAVGLSRPSGSTSLAMGDVDGDGDLDLYVANYGAVSVLRAGGQADLKLVNGQWVVTGPYAQRLKLVQGRLEEVGEADVLYLNDGQGRFAAVPWHSEFFLDEDGRPKAPPEDYGLSVQMRDLNGDRAPEIYVCNDFQTVDRFWVNDGRGHFRALPRLAVRKQSFSSMGVDFGDLDRDGHWDFFVTEMMGRYHSTRMRQVVGMGLPDQTLGLMENRPEAARNTLFRDWGDGTYAEIAQFAGVAASDWTWQGVLLDVDLDGYEDILIGNGMAYDVQDRDVLRRVRALGQQTPEQSRTNLLMYPPYLSPNIAWRNRGNLTFEDASHAWGFESTQISQGIALADFDRDGDLDVAINCLNARPLLYRNDSTAPIVAVRLQGDSPNVQGIGAVIRLLGGAVRPQMQEVVCGGYYLSGSEALRTFAAGAATNGLSLEVRWRSGRTSRVRGVLPNRVYLLAEAEAEPPLPSQPPPANSAPLFEDVSQLLSHQHHEIEFDDYARQPLLMKRLSQLGPSVAWFDLDGDGQDELFVGAGRGGACAVFRRDPAGALKDWSPADAPPLPDDLLGLAAWFDDEGRRVLLGALARYESARTNLPAVLLCTLGDKPAGPPQLGSLATTLPSASSPGSLAVADVDGDGDLDIFVGGRVVAGLYPTAPTSLIVRQDQSRWLVDPNDEQLLRGVGMVSGAIWSDLEADGYPELVLACEWGPIRVYENRRGRLREVTAEWGLAPLTGWWNGIAAGDLDEDGRLDLIAGNWGLNTGCEAAPDRPLELLYADFEGRGAMDLIEGGYAPELKTSVPRRSLNALAQAFPQMLERFPTHRAFAQAALADVLAALPSRAAAVSATTLETMVLLNRGRRFDRVDLPAEAQWSPAFAVCVADCDGDGHEDVFLSQNFFGTRPEWPRLDGGRGLWLRGKGDGRLVPVPGKESGVLVYGDQRGAAVGDYDQDGRVDLVVTQNSGPTRLFRNARAQPGLRVRLKGPKPNPDGVGAVVRLQFGDRWGPAREIRAGSGYGSQDSLVPVLGLPSPARAYEIRWPGGRTTRGSIPEGVTELVIGGPPTRILETPYLWSADQVFGRLSPFGFQGFYGARRGKRERETSGAFPEVEGRWWSEAKPR